MMVIISNVIAILVVILIILIFGSFLMVEANFVRNTWQSVEGFKHDLSEIENPDKLRYAKESLAGIEYVHTLPMESVSIKSFDGLKLYGYIIPAEKETDKVLMCVHGYRANGLYEFGSRLKFLHELGYNLLVVDDRAHGRSEGRFIGFSILDSRDVLTWGDFLKERYGEDIKLYLYGISMGAATVLAATVRMQEILKVQGVIADCGFSSGWEEIAYQLKGRFHLPKWPILYISDMWIKILGHYSLKDYEAKKEISAYDGRLLIIHGGSDDFVPTFMSKEIEDAANCDKRVCIIPNAEHAMSHTMDPEKYEDELKRFLDN